VPHASRQGNHVSESEFVEPEVEFEDFADADDGGWVLPAVVHDLESALDDPVTVFPDLPPIDGDVVALAADSEDVKQFEIDGVVIRDRVVNRLVALNIVTTEQIRDSLGEWERVRAEGYHVALWRLLTLMPGVDRERIFAEAASVYRFPHGNISRKDTLYFIEKIVNVFADEDINRMLELFVIPVGQEIDRRTGETKWFMATHDPTRPEVHKLLRELNLKRFELYYASESLIGGLITEGFLAKNEYLERLNDNPLVYDIGANFQANEELVDNEELEAEINRSSLINLFEATLVEAVNLGASDIHIFPNPDSQIEIHFRVDGHLEMWHREERIHPESFLAVVKDKSKNVDRFEKDTAQDGFIQRHIGDTVIRFRVSILPIASHRPGINAESIVIRVLDDRKVLTDLAGVGMLESALTRFQQAIRQPHGMIILTGPTGSGKSTTLVAALHQVITPKVNVLTIEDPVEYLIRGVRQVKLSHHLTMEGALRALLRHDPDIVMVGEMRDKETAELAIKLANTGHLTFSTLHTNDAPSAVSRLFKMGIEPFLIAYAINIVVAQRLIRKLCPTCRVSEQPSEELLKFLGFSEQEMNETEFMTAGNSRECSTCSGQGFKGRRAVAETLYFSDAVRAQILASGDAIDEARIRAQAETEGMLSLMDSAKEIAKMGDTSVEEMMRITGS
jgi:type IV pilus assembly protein PilB